MLYTLFDKCKESCLVYCITRTCELLLRLLDGRDSVRINILFICSYEYFMLPIMSCFVLRGGA